MKTPEDFLLSTKEIPNIMSSRQNSKRQGFLGLYHPYNGIVYAGEGVGEDQELYEAYLFGENAIISQPDYGCYSFKDNIEKHCLERDTNKVYGILRPPSEAGAVNNPNDKDIFNPIWPIPGMIQGARRFSELSKIYPQITGVIIDDFWANYGRSITYENLKDIKDALIGKTLKDNEEVDHKSPASTPHLKLFVVTYERELRPHDTDTLNLIDGINFWIYNQERSYKNFDKYIEGIDEFYQCKEIIPGIYIKNGNYGDMSHESIDYLMERSIDLYDRGHVAGVLLFSGFWLAKDYISRERSIQIDLANILKNRYYPFLGEIKGQIIDQLTGNYVEKVLIRIKSTEERSGVERVIAQKFSNASGSYRFSGWAGLRGFDYKIYVEHEGYEPLRMKFKLLPATQTFMPTISIKPISQSINMDKDLQSPYVFKSTRISKVFNEEGQGIIGDLLFPYCVSITLGNSHIWKYTEDQILSVLKSVKFGKKVRIWDLDDRAMKGIKAVKENLPGCPCGMAIGNNLSNGMVHAAIIYWVTWNRWRIWDPYSQSHVKFNSKYIIV